MAASSPRSIQQLASSSPHSPSTTPSSFTSDLDHSALVLQKHPPHSSSLKLPPIPCGSPHTPSSPITSCSNISSVSNPASPVQTWVAALLKTKFYGPCPKHRGLRKNDQNLFCVDHCQKICQYCRHADHHLNKTDSTCIILHISRYMYHDVLLAKEASSLLDINDVQSYLNNGNRVVYIDRRAQPKSKLAPHAKSCTVCSRTLQDPYRFCSLFCRLQHSNDPAVLENVPLPDASPLLHQIVKKVKKEKDTQHPACTSAARRLDRSMQRIERCLQHSSRTPTSLTNKSKIPGASISRLRLSAVRKQSRKSKPRRSPLSEASALMLSTGLAAFIV